MKMHYTKILLFSLPLNILVTSSYAHNKNKSCITPHTPTIKSRVLSECDIQTLIYDNDPEMKSMKENFDRKTSQRFKEYEEHMKDKRQRCKEQCDKDIQKIIVKDKVQKSLAQKVEKGCLMCGCGLGGGVAPVWGLISGLWYATWTQYVATTASKAATDAGIAEGVRVGLVKVTEIVTKLLIGQESKVPAIDVLQKFTTGISAEDVTLSGIFKTINNNAFRQFDSGPHAGFSMLVQKIAQKPNMLNQFSSEAGEVTKAFVEAKTGILTKTSNATSSLTTAITASIIAIVVIVLVMVIIYLILRYIRKKKMKKKLQYTKLLNE
ncbi:PIR protein, putative [Plasmodium sp. gorilla clade G1]|nr:PIR protein, putative [Plasmodium sp. gorilla clade G1]